MTKLKNQFGSANERLLRTATREHIHLSRRVFVAGTLGIGSLTALQVSFGNLVEALAQSSGVATRKSAHALSEGDPEVKLLKDAVKILRDRGDAPNGWTRLATYHRDFCGVALGNEIHFGWFFLPWHRAYLTIIERHFQAAVNEPQLALPYWNWYQNRGIPAIYLGSDNPLSDPTRSPNGSEMQDDDFGSDLTEKELIDPDDFGDFGGDGPPGVGSGGDLENGPHVGGHVFVGGNMSRFGTAALDPLFFAHHGNIDRLWEVWRNADQNGTRKEPGADSGWDDRSHAFVGADGSMVEWVPSATVNTEDMGFKYDNDQPSEVIVVAGTDGLSTPLSATVQATIPLAPEAGPSTNYQIDSGGLVVKPQIADDTDGLSAPLSNTPAGDLVKSRKVFLDLKGFKIPKQTGYLHVHVDFDGGVDTLDRTVSLNSPSYAGSFPLVPAGNSGDESSAVNVSIDITNRVSKLEVKLTDLSVLVVPFSRTGERLGEATEVESLSLRIQ